MAVLVLTENIGGELNRDATAKAVGAVSDLGEVTVLAFGADGAQAAEIAGVARVLVAECPALGHGLAEPVADLVVSLAGQFTHIVAASTTSAKNILPRIAALLDVMIIPDVSTVINAETFERPIYAGNALQKVRSRDTVKILTIRIANFGSAGNGPAAPVERIAFDGTGPATWLADEVAVNDRPDLGSAERVVSGGRGIGSGENFAIVEALADKLGAAVGASRAAVDSGYAPNDCQVGQTGRVVAPDLYIAVGISGAIQHLAGMKDSKVIVAINKDEDAPIFQVADYGLVGDLFTLVPELTGKL